jgi:hypothetical protein
MTSQENKRLIGFPLLALGLSLSASGAGTDRPAEVHHYTISVDYALSRLWVEARFASSVDSVRAQSRDAGKFLIDVQDCDNDQKIRMRNRRMLLPENGIRCLNYTVDLAKAAKHNKNYRSLSPSNIIVSPSLWLWRPKISRQSEIEARLRLPDDLLVSVPWTAIGGAPDRYRITRSPESADAEVVFGKFDYANVSVPGATLRVSVLRNGSEFDSEEIFNWIRTSATDVSLAYGRFPHPSPQVIVVPVPTSVGGSAVPYGRVIRNGGDMVQFFVNPAKPIDEFMGDWTATHEFSHLLLPYVSRQQRWISEGFAQYYQNVLLARSGEYDQQHAWQKLYEGFERGRNNRRPDLTLAELSPNMRENRSFMRVYWSGAWYFLSADVELRRISGGSLTLDSALGMLNVCCRDRSMSAREIVRKLDYLTANTVFTSLFAQVSNSRALPPAAALFDDLGIAIEEGRVSILSDHPGSHIRRGIGGFGLRDYSADSTNSESSAP